MGVEVGVLSIRLEADLRRWNAGMLTAKGDVRSLGGIVQQQAQSFNKIGLMATGASAAMVSGLAAATRVSASFEQQLAQVSTMLDDTTMKYLPEYSKQLRSLSVDFAEGTGTLSKGLYDILSASVDAGKAVDVLRASVVAAKAGLTDTGIAADAITTILNSYQLNAEQAGDVSDWLFAIVKRGKTTFAELAPSIGKIASTAAIAKVSLEELGAMVATLTRAGIRTDEAMTSVNGVLRTFMNATTEAQQAAREYGFELNTATIGTEGLMGVMKRLNDLTADQLAVIFPNIRGLKGIAAAMQNVEGYAKDLEIMYDRSGVAAEAFAQNTDTVEFALGQIRQALLDMVRDLGDPFIPKIKAAREQLLGFHKDYKAFTQAHPQVVQALSDTSLKLTSFLGTVAGVSLAIRGLGFIMQPLKQILVPLAANFTKFALAGNTFLTGLGASTTTVLWATLGEVLVIFWGISKAIKAINEGMAAWDAKINELDATYNRSNTILDNAANALRKLRERREELKEEDWKLIAAEKEAYNAYIDGTISIDEYEKAVNKLFKTLGRLKAEDLARAQREKDIAAENKRRAEEYQKFISLYDKGIDNMTAAERGWVIANKSAVVQTVGQRKVLLDFIKNVEAREALAAYESYLDDFKDFQASQPEIMKESLDKALELLKAFYADDKDMLDELDKWHADKIKQINERWGILTDAEESLKKMNEMKDELEMKISVLEQEKSLTKKQQDELMNYRRQLLDIELKLYEDNLAKQLEERRRFQLGLQELIKERFTVAKEDFDAELREYMIIARMRGTQERNVRAEALKLMRDDREKDLNLDLANARKLMAVQLREVEGSTEEREKKRATIIATWEDYINKRIAEYIERRRMMYGEAGEERRQFMISLHGIQSLLQNIFGKTYTLRIERQGGEGLNVGVVPKGKTGAYIDTSRVVKSLTGMPDVVPKMAEGGVLIEAHAGELIAPLTKLPDILSRMNIAGTGGGAPVSLQMIVQTPWDAEELYRVIERKLQLARFAAQGVG
jgi:TP901 family phage tail tape measure protein